MISPGARPGPLLAAEGDTFDSEFGACAKESGVTRRKIETSRAEFGPLGSNREARRVDKFSARRIELAEGRVGKPWAELGYARTSLREIAQEIRVYARRAATITSATRSDLICCCVRHYKAKCVTRYDQVTIGGAKPRRTDEGFSGKSSARRFADEARMHRLLVRTFRLAVSV